MRYRLLDPLRGLAALWVFGFHLEWADQNVFSRLMKMGSLGVAVFFVISGYCVSAAARRAIAGEQSAASFLYRRFRRVYPPYWFAILLPLAVPFVVEFVSMLKTGHYVAPHLRCANWGVWDWLGVATMTKVFDPTGTDLQTKFTPLNAVFWSLAIEVQFYAAMALAVKFRHGFYRLLAILSAASIPCLFWTGLDFTGLFLPYWPTFALGILLFALIECKLTPQRLLGKWARLAGLLVLLVGFAIPLIIAAWDFHIPTIAFAGSFAITIYFAYALEDSINKLQSSPQSVVRILTGLWVLLGAMSYSIYLVHVPLSHLGEQICRRLFISNSMAFNVGVLLVTCLLIYPFYRFCEAPFVNTPRRMLVAQPELK